MSVDLSDILRRTALWEPKWFSLAADYLQLFKNNEVTGEQLPFAADWNDSG